MCNFLFIKNFSNHIQSFTSANFCCNRSLGIRVGIDSWLSGSKKVHRSLENYKDFSYQIYN